VKVEKLPWAAGKSHLTITYAWFLAAWCKRLSWKEVAEVFATSWDTVFRSVETAVAWGLEHRDLSGITAIGTDEICWRKRKDTFVTLVYQLDQGKRRLLWIGPDRTAKTFRGFLTKSRWCLLKRPETLTEKQVDRLKDLFAGNRRNV
jgi:transposase